MSPDFKGIKSLRLEDSITHLWITLYNVSIKGSQKLYRCQLFDLSCNILIIINYKKVYLSGAPYVFDVAKTKK